MLDFPLLWFWLTFFVSVLTFGLPSVICGPVTWSLIGLPIASSISAPNMVLFLINPSFLKDIVKHKHVLVVSILCACYLSLSFHKELNFRVAVGWSPQLSFL